MSRYASHWKFHPLCIQVCASVLWRHREQVSLCFGDMMGRAIRILKAPTGTSTHLGGSGGRFGGGDEGGRVGSGGMAGGGLQSTQMPEISF